MSLSKKEIKIIEELILEYGNVVDFDSIYKKLEKDILDEFKYEAGTDPEAKPLLSTFNPEDPGEFIL